MDWQIHKKSETYNMVKKYIYKFIVIHKPILCIYA